MHVFLIRALAEGGRSDVLHKIYSREDRGGYGFMVRQGLTTLPESWDAKPGTGSSQEASAGAGYSSHRSPDRWTVRRRHSTARPGGSQ